MPTGAAEGGVSRLGIVIFQPRETTGGIGALIRWSEVDGAIPVVDGACIVRHDGGL